MDVDLIDIIIMFALGWVTIKAISFLLFDSQSVTLEQREAALKYLEDIIHDVEIEKIGDIEYWYDKNDKEFLGQGKTFDEIVSVLKIRFPTHVFLIQDKGAISIQTGWKIATTEELSKIRFRV